MLRTGRKPRNTFEKMIVNNYRALILIRKHVNDPLSIGLIEEVHTVLVEGTIESGEVNRYRRPEDKIGVYDEVSNRLLFVPPAASQLSERLERLVDVANRPQDDHDSYVHPVLKAVLLHFWLAYIHPFTDGNGRTARALFYWSMLRSGYWLTEYISISRVIKQAPAAYGKSFLYTETDDSDLTYFFLAQLKVLTTAISGLESYIQAKSREMRDVVDLLAPAFPLNHRQRALIGRAIRKPSGEYTISSHQGSHDVTYQTARSDLLDMETKGLLDKRKVKKRYVFSAVSDLRGALIELSGRG